jgi:uncharacterized protein (DUF1778 family)
VKELPRSAESAIKSENPGPLTKSISLPWRRSREQRSAGFQPAVSPISNRQNVRNPRRRLDSRRPQAGNLRYDFVNSPDLKTLVPKRLLAMQANGKQSGARMTPKENMPIVEDDKSRVTARVPAEMRQALEEAAQLQGSTLNQFIVQSAFQEAQRVLERETVIRLSRRDAQKVFSLLERPPKANKQLKEALKAYRELVRV